jgi:pilus assembly protein Flp/PilA
MATQGRRMNRFVLKTWIRARLARDERGANLVEYLLLVALIAVAVMAAILFMGGQLKTTYSSAGSHLSSQS